MLTYEKVVNKDYNEDERQKLNRVARMLKEGTTKDDVANAINSGERQARDVISAVSYILPVISSAGEKGYRLARTRDDVPDNERKIWDRLSRIQEMLYTLLPNFDFEHKNNISFERLEKAIQEFLSALAEPKIAQYFVNDTEK